MTYSKEELKNILAFLKRVDLQGEEAYVWVGLNEKIKHHLNILLNPQLVDDVEKIEQLQEQESHKKNDKKKDIR